MNRQAVFFDLYETLISEYKDGVRRASRAGRNYQELLGISNETFKREWGLRQAPRMTGQFPDYPSVVQDIAACCGVECSEESLERLYTERIEEKAAPFADISPDITGMLDGLKKRGIRLGLISNCTEEEVRAWDASVLPPYFDVVLFSYKAGCAKPDARIYELACSRMGVRPEQALFVGDGGSNELDGARAAGLTAYHATWFIPDSISGKITGHPKLAKPAQLLDEIAM